MTLTLQPGVAWLSWHAGPQADGGTSAVKPKTEPPPFLASQSQAYFLPQTSPARPLLSGSSF